MQLDDSHTYLHSFCFALVASFCFEKIFSVKLFIAKYFNLFSFSQVALIVILLKRYLVANVLVAATISYLPNIGSFLHNFICIVLTN